MTGGSVKYCSRRVEYIHFRFVFVKHFYKPCIVFLPLQKYASLIYHITFPIKFVNTCDCNVTECEAWIHPSLHSTFTSTNTKIFFQCKRSWNFSTNRHGTWKLFAWLCRYQCLWSYCVSVRCWIMWVCTWGGAHMMPTCCLNCKVCPISLWKCKKLSHIKVFINGWMCLCLHKKAYECMEKVWNMMKIKTSLEEKTGAAPILHNFYISQNVIIMQNASSHTNTDLVCVIWGEYTVATLSPLRTQANRVTSALCRNVL